MRNFNFFKRDHLLSRVENIDTAYEKGKRIIDTMTMKSVPAVNQYIRNFYKLYGGLLNEECWVRYTDLRHRLQEKIYQSTSIMKDINGISLAVGRTIVVACKDQSVANVPILKKGVIEELVDNSYIKVRYEDTGRLTTISGYMHLVNKRICVVK